MFGQVKMLVEPTIMVILTGNLVIWGFHKWGYPNSWNVYLLENPNLKRMRTGGSPMTLETP
jgi:hypothetical protein